MYFHGPHRFQSGVYAKGIVDGIDREASQVSLRVREYQTDTPITPSTISTRVAEVVAPRYRQVFLWPDDWTVAPHCRPKACANRRCGDCPTWTTMPLIEIGDSTAPRRLHGSAYEALVAAHWIVPRRCYETRIDPKIKMLTNRFTAFKLGEMAYAYPFALSIFEQLRRRDLLEFDHIVPVPLSPDKLEKGEKHRTRELAKELGQLLAIRVREMLSLTASISKRRMLAAGFTPPQFEQRYRAVLQAEVPDNSGRILLVDDVMTKGSTAAQALHVLKQQRPGLEIVVATAGQMIVKEVVVNKNGFKAQKFA